MYKLITSARDTDDLSIRSDRDQNRRRNELTYDRNRKTKYHIKVMFMVKFGFAEHHEKATYGLGYKLTLIRNIDNSVLNKADATIVGRIKINGIEWYVPHYTPSISNQAILSKQILSKVPTELQYVERSVFMKNVNTKNFGTFELGTQEGINVLFGLLLFFNKELDKVHRI